MKSLDKDLIIRNHLKKFFKLIFQRTLELYFKNVTLEELTQTKFEEYLSDSILETMVRLKEGVSLFVSFFSDYVKGATLSYELFCGLVRALGSEDYIKIFYKQVELDDVIDSSKIDVDYFKFQVRTTLDLYLHDAIITFIAAYRKARNLPRAVDYTNSEFVKKFILVFESQTEDWLKIRDGIYSYYENTLPKRNLEEMISGLKKIIYNIIDMAERLQIVQEFIDPRKSWKELLIDDMQRLGRKIERIKEEISLIADYRIKYYEHGFNATIFLLKMLWGNEELAIKKIEAFARTKISTEELLPKEIQLDDLAFGLMGARKEFNLVGQAADVLKEKIHVLHGAADILASRDLQSLYEEIVETIKGHDSFWEETYETLLTIQDLTVEAINKG